MSHYNGGESIGYPGVIHGLFPNGGADLLQYFDSTCNYELNKILKKEALAIQEDPLKSRKAREHLVYNAIVTRLKMIIPYKKTWPQAIAIKTLTQYRITALANLITLADDICYYAGDRSVDFNWYTRRIMLASIYNSTELYMLQDTSEDHKETWLFVERRMKDAVELHKIFCNYTITASSDEVVNRATDTATSVFVTARNILGLNWKR